MPERGEHERGHGHPHRVDREQGRAAQGLPARRGDREHRAEDGPGAEAGQPVDRAEPGRRQPRAAACEALLGARGGGEGPPAAEDLDDAERDDHEPGDEHHGRAVPGEQPRQRRRARAERHEHDEQAEE